LQRNLFEGFCSIFFGANAGSIALIGFDLDSIIESLSGLILILRLRQHGVCSEGEESTNENRAIKFVAATFFLLGAYVLYESAKKLIFIEIPEPSLPGIIIASLSVIIMPIFSFRKRDLGMKINSKALVANSEKTLTCTFHRCLYCWDLQQTTFSAYGRFSSRIDNSSVLDQRGIKIVGRVKE